MHSQESFYEKLTKILLSKSEILKRTMLTKFLLKQNLLI